MKDSVLTVKQIKWGVAALVLLYVLSVLVNLGMMELEGEEPRRAVVSLEMMHSGNYLNPTLFGWPYLNKPPVFNWILIGSMRLLHSASEFALRLPSLFFYVLWAAVHYRFSKKFFAPHLALLSAFMMLTCADLYFYGLANGAEIDIFYSFVVYLQAIAIFHFYLKKEWLQLYLVSYALCALGFLTKGFPSIVFEGLTLIAVCIYAKSAKPLFKWQHLAGGALFFALVGLYFWGYSFGGNAQHLLVNFLNESLVKSGIGERSHKVVEKAVGYPVLVLKLLAPWSLLLLTLLVKKVRQQVWRNAFVRFSLLFIFCNLWVYWLTGQPKARYIYMFVPFATTLFVHLYQTFTEVQEHRLDKIFRWFGVVFPVAALALLVLPFAVDVSVVASLLFAAVLAAFSWIFFKTRTALRTWAFVSGIILLRLAYAVVFIPVQAQATAYYQQPVNEGVQKVGAGEVKYWAPPQEFVVSVDTKLFSLKADTILQPPLIHPQVPYYHYKHTGSLLHYDSTFLKDRTYISFARDIEGRSVDTIYSFSDKRGTEQMLYYRVQ